MKRIGGTLACVFALLAGGCGLAGEGGSTRVSLEKKQAGPLAVGMRKTEIRQALARMDGAPWDLVPEEEGSETWFIVEKGTGERLMELTFGSALDAVAVLSDRFATRQGVRVGSHLREVAAAMGGDGRLQWVGAWEDLRIEPVGLPGTAFAVPGGCVTQDDVFRAVSSPESDWAGQLPACAAVSRILLRRER